MTAQPLHTISEAAELLHIPEATLRKKVTMNAVPHRRVFRHVRFSNDDLAAIQEIRGPMSAVTGRARQSGNRGA